MAWQETAGFLQMYHFHLTPAAPDVPQEIRDSCAQFVQDLQAALADQDRSALEALFAPDLRQDPAATADLLFALAEGAQWEIVQISLEPFAVIVVVPTGSTSLLLQLDLTPASTTGCSRDCKLCPCLSVWTRCTTWQRPKLT